MKIFDIYHSNIDKNLTIAVEEGFCIKGFIFGVFWALYHRMWAVVTISVLIAILSSISNHSISFFLNNLLMLVYGFFGQDFLAYKISKKYTFKDIVIAYSSEEAEIKYRNLNFKNNQKDNICTT